ncbi:MAG: T9SS type A sorting domain-containing protein [Sphingobacteriia bacterium]|nr:T9SS type A sorting domain-containing protein [Sphingobacteriia bacterium]
MRLITLGFVLFFFSTLQIKAQTVKMTYDASGNRISREIEVKDISNSEVDSLLSLKEKTIDPDQDGILSTTVLYPNPTNDQINIVISEIGDQIIDGALYDLGGREVLSVRKLLSHNRIDVKDFKPGTYILRLFTDGETRSWKIIVDR